MAFRKMNAAGLFWIALFVGGAIGTAGMAADEPAKDYETETLRGRVVFLAAEFEKQTGIATVPEARERILALKQADGALVPLLEDVRGRAFRRDERLRQMDVELVVRRYRQVPVVQIIRVMEVTNEGRYDLDYWCEICAIAMFEQKDCECCQGPVELRRRKVTESTPTNSASHAAAAASK